MVLLRKVIIRGTQTFFGHQSWVLVTEEPLRIGVKMSTKVAGLLLTNNIKILTDLLMTILETMTILILFKKTTFHLGRMTMEMIRAQRLK